MTRKRSGGRLKSYGGRCFLQLPLPVRMAVARPREAYARCREMATAAYFARNRYTYMQWARARNAARQLLIAAVWNEEQHRKGAHNGRRERDTETRVERRSIAR